MPPYVTTDDDVAAIGTAMLAAAAAGMTTWGRGTRTSHVAR